MATTAELLNSIRGVSSAEYQNRIPVATQTNITAVGNAITSYEATANEFISALVNRIGKVIVSSKMATNKLSIFKKGTLPFGKDIEEVFVEMAQSIAFDQADSEDTVMKRTLPDVKSIFHRENRKDLYPVTVSHDMLKSAFLSEGGLKDLVSKIINSLYSGDNYDEYVLTKELLAQYSANYYTVEVPEVTDEATGKVLVKAIKQASTNLTFMSTTYNKQAVKQMTPIENQYLILHKNVNTQVEIDVLAAAFNMSKTDFVGHVIIVDDFGSMEDTQALLIDKDFLQIYDTLFKMTEQYNPKGLYTNFFLHHWQVLSTSQFQNAVKFVLPAVTP